MDDAEITRELIERLSLDVAATTLATNSGAGKDAIAAALCAHAEENTTFLKALVSVHGWPRQARFGEYAEGAAGWLLVFSAHIDPLFQYACLDLLAQLLPAGEVDAEFYAFTVDRVLMSQGLRQRYGTQESERHGRMVIDRVEDPLRLNARRIQIGLGPLNLNARPGQRRMDRPGLQRPATKTRKRRNRP